MSQNDYAFPGAIPPREQSNLDWHRCHNAGPNVSPLYGIGIVVGIGARAERHDFARFPRREGVNPTVIDDQVLSAALPIDNVDAVALLGSCQLVRDVTPVGRVHRVFVIPVIVRNPKGGPALKFGQTWHVAS